MGNFFKKKNYAAKGLTYRGQSHKAFSNYLKKLVLLVQPFRVVQSPSTLTPLVSAAELETKKNIMIYV